MRSRLSARRAGASFPYPLTASNALLYTLGVRKVLVAVRVKPKDFEALKKRARIEQESVSEIIRKLIEEFLKK